MRGPARIGLGLFAALLALTAATILFGRLIVESAVRDALAKQGFVEPTLRVSALGAGALVIDKLTAGKGPAPDLAIDRIKVRYDLGEAIAKKRLRAIEFGPGRIVATLGADGRLSVAGFVYTPPKEREPLPFDALTLQDVTIGLRTPDGVASGAVSGAFSQADGGTFKLSANAARIGARGIVLTGAVTSGALSLAKDGAVTVKGEARSDAASPLGAAKNVALTFSVNGSSWRDALAGDAAAFKGAGRIDLKSADIPASTAPALASVQGFAPFRMLSLSGAMAISASGSRVSVSAADGHALVAKSDSGDSITVGPIGAEPLFAAEKGAQRLQVMAAATGVASGRVQLDAARNAAGPWRFTSEGALGAQRFGATGLRAATFDAKGSAAPDLKSVSAEATLSVHLSQLVVGRFAVEDAPIRAALRVAADMRAETLTIDALPSSCVSLQRGRFTIAGEATEARLVNARLCPDGGPLLAARFGGTAHADVKGRLAASNAFYRIAATTMNGAPPDINFEAAYDPAHNTTRVTGALKGGRIALNDLVLLSAADGTFTGGLDARGLSGEASLKSLLLSHRAEPEQFSAVRARGDARLARDIVNFRFNAATPGGKPLGAGAGFHDLAKARGEMQFATGKLEFAPGALQIAGLLPALRGVVGGATGAVASDLRAAWKPGVDGFSSSGEFRIDNLSFRGPGVAVSETAGISGVVRLASLAPLKSDGPQSISIKTIDMGALKLEGGALDFDLPGDETVRVIRGEFPWFGGKIGAYGANAKLGRDSLAVNLRAENVDLKQMLDFLKIPGLSGEGLVEGTLPLVIEGGKSFIRDGDMIATTPGVVRYTGQVTDAAAANNKGAKIAFDLLRELRFQKLGAKIDGPLDGDLKFTIIFEGSNDVVVNEQKVRSPVIYRITLEAPLLALLEQAQVSTNPRLQLERSGVLPEKKVKE